MLRATPFHLTQSKGTCQLRRLERKRLTQWTRILRPPNARNAGSRSSTAQMTVHNAAIKCRKCRKPTLLPEPENKQLAADHVRPGDVATVRPPISNSQVGQSQAPGRPQVLTEQLVMLAQDGTAQRIIQLAGERVDLGRTEGEIVLSEDVYLSARHARFEGREGVRTLVDLGSLNGIFLRIRGSVCVVRWNHVLNRASAAQIRSGNAGNDQFGTHSSSRLQFVRIIDQSAVRSPERKDH